MSLAGNRALVTGSTKGIGLAIAEALLSEGIQTVISSRNEKEIRDVVTSLNASGSGRVIGKACDVRDPLQVQQLIQFCVKELGGIDILVNNAGVGIFKTVEEMTPEQWQTTIATNLDGVFYGCHFAIQEMKKSGKGFIINISSLAGKNAFPKGAAYNASKFALTGFSEALMQEVRYENIRVAYIMPGSVDTDFAAQSLQRKDSWKIAPGDIADLVVETLKRHPRCLTSRIEVRPSRPQK